ncbi:MAG TPA: 2-oxo acid dehydrogenase subunit E2, partial [Mycobacteriales bacterium]|nr:2-oxo acid dehydrogenase subunit E2 [Mycobacteriales bacterium]
MSVDAEKFAGFGPNEWLVYEMYQSYLKDPNSVDKAWWDFFADYAPGDTPVVSSRPTDGSADSSAASAAPSPPAAPVETPMPVAPVPTAPESTTDAAPAVAPGRALKGAAARTVANMEASLAVPTATSVRAIPAKLLIDNRVVINNHLRRGRGGKVSFTHLIGYAMVQALRDMPVMNRAYAETDGKPTLLEPEHVNLGLAIDLTKDDGTHTLVVPSIKNADTLDFAKFWAAYEDIVRKARTNKLTVDDFT